MVKRGPAPPIDPDSGPPDIDSSGQGAEFDGKEHSWPVQQLYHLAADLAKVGTKLDQLSASSDKHDARLHSLEVSTAKILSALERLEPKIEHIHGFSTHTAPHLASKSDLEKTKGDLMEKISDRPTTIVIIAIVAAVAAILAIPFFGDWWDHLKHLVESKPSSP